MDEKEKTQKIVEEFYNDMSNRTILRDYRALAGFSTGIISMSSDMTIICSVLRKMVQPIRIENNEAVETLKKFSVEFSDGRKSPKTVYAFSKEDAVRKVQEKMTRCGFAVKKVAE